MRWRMASSHRRGVVARLGARSSVGARAFEAPVCSPPLAGRWPDRRLGSAARARRHTPPCPSKLGSIWPSPPLDSSDRGSQHGDTTSHANLAMALAWTYAKPKRNWLLRSECLTGDGCHGARAESRSSCFKMLPTGSIKHFVSNGSCQTPDSQISLTLLGLRLYI